MVKWLVTLFKELWMKKLTSHNTVQSWKIRNQKLSRLISCKADVCLRQNHFRDDQWLLRCCAEVLVYFFILETGMDTSPTCRAGLGRGASTVSTPSGERVEVTFSESTVGGRLQREERGCLWQKTQFTKSLFKRLNEIQVATGGKLFLKVFIHSRVFPGETSANESLLIPPLLMLPYRQKMKGSVHACYLQMYFRRIQTY